MKFSVVVALSIAALASAQVPKATGAPKGTGPPKPTGAPGAAGAPKGGPCAAQCLMQPLQSSGCKLTGLFPKGGAGPAGGAPGAGGAGGFPKGGAGGPPKGGAGGLPKPASGGMAGMPGMNMLAARQAPPTPTGAPKFSLSPEQSSAIASARSCFCAAPALKAAAETCVPSACATATDAGAGALKMLNSMCKGVGGFAPLTVPAGPAAARAAPTPA